jgi:hypothetical protein
MIFETQGRGQYPLKWLPQGKRTLESYGGWADADYQSGPDRIVKGSRRWITFSALEWIIFRALQTEPFRPLLPRAFQRGVEELLHSEPTFLDHGSSLLALWQENRWLAKRASKWEGGRQRWRVSKSSTRPPWPLACGRAEGVSDANVQMLFVRSGCHTRSGGSFKRSKTLLAQ